jgi:hypothetical protein
MSTSPIDLSSAALFFIDLQRGIVNLPLLPRSGEEVVQRAARLGARFQEAQAVVVRSLEEVLSACTDSGVHQPVDLRSACRLTCEITGA